MVVAISGEDGSFTLVGLFEGRYRLRVEGPEIFPSEVRFFDVPADGLRLIVARKVGVQGVVVDGAGTPAVDVAVSLSGERHGGVHNTRTDDTGAFSFEDLQEGVFQVWAAREATAAPALRVSRLGPGPFEPVELVLGPAAIVTGQVVDRKSGQGVSAAVTLSATSSDEPTRYARSGPDGNFRIEGVPLGRWSASAYAPGYVATEAIEFAAGSAFVPVIALTQGAVISGQVVDQNGSPVRGAVVSAQGRSAQGRSVVFGEQAESLRLRQASGLPAPGAMPPPGALAGDARFVPRGELGVLLGPIPFPPPKGAAALRIAEALSQGEDQATPALTVRPEAESSFVTDGQGRFRLAGLDAGSYRLLATHAQYADALGKPLTLALGQTMEGVKIIMVQGVVLVGTVTNQRGEVIVGATIIVDPIVDRAAATVRGKPGTTPDDDLAGTLRLQAVTGLDGQYRLGPLATDAEVRVTAVHHGDVERTIRLGKLADRQEERVEDFVLPVADAVLAGRVRDAMGFPLRGAVITLAGRTGKNTPRSPQNSMGRQATSDDSGRFAIDWLPAGSYRVTVAHTDFPAYETTGTTDAEAELTVPFGGGIEGQVRDAHTGQPVSGALVVATGPGKVETAAGQDGGIDLVPLAAGQWTLQASAPGYVAASTRVDVPAGNQPREVTVRDLRLELARGAIVAGTVRDANGVRVRGAKVTVGQAGATTDEQGFFRIRDAPTGNIVITAERHGARGTLAVSLAPGDELVTLELHLQGTIDEP